LKAGFRLSLFGFGSNAGLKLDSQIKVKIPTLSHKRDKGGAPVCLAQL